MNKYRFEQINPIASFIFFILVLVVAMLTFNPIIISISFVFSIIDNFIYYGKKTIKLIIIDLILIILLGLINPLFSHQGTILLFTLVNNYYLEALIYGMVAGMMIACVINYSKVLSYIIDSSKFNYLFSKALPKTSLVLSIAYNYIPRLNRDYQEIDDSLKALGYFSSKKRSDLIKAKLKSYSMLITLSLENSIETSDSMICRGYTNNKRKSYSIIKFNIIDIIYFIVFIIIGGASIGYISKYSNYSYYPKMDLISFDLNHIIMYSLVFVLNSLLLIIEGCDWLKWQCLKSKI